MTEVVEVSSGGKFLMFILSRGTEINKTNI